MVGSKNRRKVKWERSVKEAKSKYCDFEFNAKFDRKPVEFDQQGSDMVILLFLEYKTCSRVLDKLKTVKLISR